jgi:hypothetical protein
MQGHVKVAVVPQGPALIEHQQRLTHSLTTGTSEFSGSLQLAMGTTTATMDSNADGEQGRMKKGGFRTMPLILGEEIDMPAHRFILQLFTPICGVCTS